MTQNNLIEQTKRFVEQQFAGEGSGHDWAHMYRVWQLSKTIAESEPDADTVIVELGALLHDIADWKFHDGDDSAGPKAAREWLESIKADSTIVDQVEHIVANISFHAALNSDRPPLSTEAAIVHDADKLDAIGAIGIARTFIYGGSKGRPMYDPAIKPKTHDSAESYRKGNENNTTINHFYEKLLLLKDMMITDTGKRIAQNRHEYMEQFLDEFYAEWNGKR